MFVKNDDLVKVQIYFKHSGHKFMALTQMEVDKRIKDKKMTVLQLDSDFEKLTVNMAVLSWGSYNQFQDNASKLTPKGERYFDYKSYKEERLKQLIKSWDAVSEGKPVPVTEQTIMALVPVIGDTIVRGYDDESFYDEDAEKK